MQTRHYGDPEYGWVTWVRFLYINEGSKRVAAPSCHIFDGLCEDPGRLLTSSPFLKPELCRDKEVLVVHRLTKSRHDHRFEQLPNYGEQRYQPMAHPVMLVTCFGKRHVTAEVCHARGLSQVARTWLKRRTIGSTMESPAAFRRSVEVMSSPEALPYCRREIQACTLSLEICSSIGLCTSPKIYWWQICSCFPFLAIPFHQMEFATARRPVVPN